MSRYFRRAYQKDHRFKRDFTAEISDQGIHVVTPFPRRIWNGTVCTLAGIERHLHSFLSAMELHPLSQARIRSRRWWISGASATERRVAGLMVRPQPSHDGGCGEGEAP
jgi:hypothetical protein